MLFKALQILESIKENAGYEAYENIIKSCGSLGDNATPNKQSEYVRDMLNELENAYGAEMAVKVMRPCGYQCITDGIIKKAKIEYKKSESLDDFLKRLNELHIGGGGLHISDGRIIGVYEKCYCGLPKYAKGLSPEYCNCSAGWFEKLFSEAIGKNVEVRKIKTILEGADQCLFQIIIQ